MKRKELDIRRGFPSASAFGRLKACPGSHALISSLAAAGRLYQLPDPDRESGLKIHASLAGTLTELDEAERKSADRCAELRDKVLRGWLGTEAIPPGFELLIEKRLWYPSVWLPSFSGAPDFVVINRPQNWAGILNYKTGRKESEPAADNLQLRAEAVLVKNAYPELKQIEAGIIEPWVTSDVELVRYDEAALVQAAAELAALASRPYWETEHRVAGKWCEYCPARAHCPEARSFAIQYYQVAFEIVEKQALDLPLGARGDQVLDNILTVRNVLDSLEQRYKQALAEKPDALETHYLHEGKLIQKITDLKWMRTEMRVVANDEEIDRCATWWPTKLEELYRAKGMRTFSQTIGPYIDAERGEPYIAKRGKKQRERREAQKKAEAALNDG